MLNFLYILAASTPSTTAKGAKTTGGSSYTILIFIVLIVAVYIFFIRPRSQRARQAQQMQKQFQLGDDVVSIGGITGRVVGLDDDEVEVEVSDGVTLTFLRRAVNLRNPAPPPAPSTAGGGLSGLFRGRPAQRPAPAATAPAAEEEWDDSEFEGAADGEDVVAEDGVAHQDADGEVGGMFAGTDDGGLEEEYGEAEANGSPSEGLGGSTGGSPAGSGRRRNRRPRRGGGTGGPAGGR